MWRREAQPLSAVEERSWSEDVLGLAPLHQFPVDRGGPLRRDRGKEPLQHRRMVIIAERSQTPLQRDARRRQKTTAQRPADIGT